MIIAKAFADIFNLILPRKCAVCSQRLSTNERYFCTVCAAHLPRTHFAQTAYDNKMARMLWGRTWVEKVAAYFYYSSGSDTANLIYKLKYFNKPQIGYEVATMLAKEPDFQTFFDGIDAIIPMPIARERRKMRGYNQCDYIADGLHAVTHIPIISNAIERTSFAESQTKLHHQERLENVEGVFRLKDDSRLSAKHVLLVDDVMTTGATITSCTNELLRAKDVKVSVLTLGFVNPIV